MEHIIFHVSPQEILFIYKRNKTDKEIVAPHPPYRTINYGLPTVRPVVKNNQN